MGKKLNDGLFSNGYTNKPIKRTKIRPGNAYPYLDGFNQVDFVGECTGKYMQAKVTLTPYKGNYLLDVTDENLGTCSHQASAWLDGDSLDALIELLKRAKKQWAADYRRTKRAHQRERAKR